MARDIWAISDTHFRHSNILKFCDSTTGILVRGDDFKDMVPLLFRALDGHDVREVMLQHIEKQLTSNVKWDACAKWLGM